MTKLIMIILIVVIFLLSILSGCSEPLDNEINDIDNTAIADPIVEPDDNLQNPVSIIIKGTEYSTDLTYLYLSDMQLTNTDIEPLRHLTKLSRLYLDGNQISDISVLADLTELEHLVLYDNQISDISALKKLTKLSELSLSDNQIDDFSALAGMTELYSLGFSNNQIDDVTTLAELTSLRELWLSDNQISDISPLEGLKDLSTLDLRRNGIKDVHTIEKFAYVYRLYLTGNPIDETVILIDMLVMYNGPGGDIAIPDGVKSISYEAFYGRSDITGIFIPDSLTNIIDERNIPYIFRPFSGCTGLMNITTSKDHPIYSSKEGVLFSKDGTELVFLPSGRSGSYAIPNGVKYIRGDGVLSPFGSEGLTSISIPASVEEMSSSPFAGCPQLTEIMVNSSNNYYSAEDNVLFNKEKTTIIACPPGKTGEYTIPVGVTELGDYAFFNCIGLTSVTIPEGVTSLDYVVADYIHTAFVNCFGLTSIVIPKSVANIDDGVFDDCPDITISGYAGSEAQRYSEEKDIPFIVIKE